MGFVWETSPEEAFAALADDYERRLEIAIGQLAQRYESEIEAWMKENARWTDRTSNARQSLNTDVEKLAKNMTSIVLSHGVDYGIFLELANQGEYAIIGPALDHFAPKVWADVQELVR